MNLDDVPAHTCGLQPAFCPIGLKVYEHSAFHELDKAPATSLLFATVDLFTHEKAALSLRAFTRGRLSNARLVPVQGYHYPFQPCFGRRLTFCLPNKAFVPSSPHPAKRARVGWH